MIKKLIAVGVAFIWTRSVFGQVPTVGEPARRVVLSAQAQVEVPQDVMTLTLQVTRQGYEAATVQGQLKSALDAALVVLRQEAGAGLMDVRSGHFTVQPRYDRDGKVSVWQGSAEWVLEGTDVARIARAAGRVQGMSVSRINFGLTPAQRQQAQARAQALAVDRFRQRAIELANSFGAHGYLIDEVQVGYDDAAPQLRAPMMASRVMSDTAAVPVEAGVTTVTVSVSGSIRLRQE